MSLSDIKPQAEEIKTSGGSFAVRGLSPADIEQITRKHKQTVGAIFDHLKDSAAADFDYLETGVSLVVEAPELMAEIVAMAVDEAGLGLEEKILMVGRLPLAVQVKAISAIAALTFTVDGDLGKLVATAVQKIGGLNGVLELVAQLGMKMVKTSPSAAGSGASEAK